MKLICFIAALLIVDGIKSLEETVSYEITREIEQTLSFSFPVLNLPVFCDGNMCAYLKEKELAFAGEFPAYLELEVGSTPAVHGGLMIFTEDTRTLMIQMRSNKNDFINQTFDIGFIPKVNTIDINCGYLKCRRVGDDKSTIVHIEGKQKWESDGLYIYGTGGKTFRFEFSKNFPYFIKYRMPMTTFQNQKYTFSNTPPDSFTGNGISANLESSFGQAHFKGKLHEMDVQFKIENEERTKRIIASFTKAKRIKIIE